MLRVPVKFGWNFFCFIIQQKHKKGESSANQYLEGMTVIILVIALGSQQIFVNFSPIPEQIPGIDNIQFMT